MKKSVVPADGFADALEQAVYRIKSRKVDLNRRHILFVPDRYTLRAEQLLYEGGGAFDAEVLTFNRLFSKIVPDCPEYLSRQSAVMLLRKLVAENAGALKILSTGALKTGFAQKMYDTIAQLQSCRVSPEELARSEGDKCADLALIYGRYAESIRGKKVDASGRMDLLIGAIAQAQFLRGATVYFCLYDNVTKQGSEIIDALCAAAECAYFYESKPFARFGPCELYRADSSADELKAAARRIRDALFTGARCAELAVVCPSAYINAAKRILTEYGIPFFTDEKKRLGDAPAVRALFTLRRIFELGHRREDYIALAKNPFSGVDRADADCFENYCNRFLIDYKAFLSPFTLQGEDEGRADREGALLMAAERVRAAMQALCAFARPVYRAKTTAEFCEFIRQFCARRAFDRSDKLESVADSLLSVYGDAPFTDREWESFEDGVNVCELSVLPVYADCVVLSDAAGFRGGRFKKLFVLGFHEGEFPVFSPDAGMLTDAEIKAMDAGAKIEPTIAQINERAIVEARDLLSSADSLFVSYNGGAEQRPSFLADELECHCPEFTASSSLSEKEAALKGDKTRIARRVSCRAAAAEALCDALCGERLPFASSVYHALGGSDALIKQLVAPAAHSGLLSAAGSLFFKSGSTTISRVQEYFSCPYKHFLNYGLGLKERETGELSPLDVGNFLHRAVELFVKNGNYSDPYNDMQRIVDICAAEDKKYLYEANAALIAQLRREAGLLAEVIARQTAAGSFKNLGVEMRFGPGENDLKGPTAECGGKAVSVRGIIDRADVYDGWARVIDYKTGKADFDFSDLYYGLKIQLCLYMKVLTDSGFKPAGMFYFPAVTSWKDDDFSHVLKGVYCSDPEAYTAMDAALTRPETVSGVIAARTLKEGKSGEVRLQKSARALPLSALEGLCEYSYNVMKNGIDEILAGCIEKSPAARSYVTCVYCPYKNLCLADEEAQRVLESVDMTEAAHVDE